ncbi:PREDICTED: uncharacterized protein LOC104724939 [Camelina sativa]|uniref:Uncharacterized protein LOC104724939 n=1 Tax=Camelina sativa TaxID=90675 RepID=A0ABM0UIX5_CAMSA|nr:PREDICTED: uncharacterized protein LOC104724939 [Camelina sativa]XP_010441809.1 PREDICTED: uncharacterized protein LOC104724939 [Camelina sativa]
MADASPQGGSNPQPRPRCRLIPRPQVFISFRGEDVRNCFLRIVVMILGSRKINWFTDTRLPVGENLEELFTEIKKSKIAIVIFSKRYSDSKWCMEELSIIEELARDGKLKVVPVNYKVSHSDVKHFQGEFGESFERLKDKYELKEPENILKWKASVESIAKRKGLLSYIRGKVPAPLHSQIVNAVIAYLNKMPGGKVKPLENKLTMIDVFILAFVAAFLCRYIISPLFFNNADFFNNKKWLFGFPTAVAFWFHNNNKNDQNNPPHGTTTPTPSNTEPPPPPGTRPSPSNFKPPPLPFTRPSPPPPFTRPSPPPPPSFTRPTPSSFKRRPPPPRTETPSP